MPLRKDNSCQKAAPMVRNSSGVLYCCTDFFMTDCEIGNSHIYCEGKQQRLYDYQEDDIDDFD